MRKPERSTRVRPAPGQAPGRVFAVAAVVCILIGPMLVASAPPAGSQAAGGKAPAKVALTFTEFHGFTATADYLKKVAAAYPAITELIEIGRSPGNRPIYLLVVSNMKTGVPLDSLVPLQNPRQPAVNNVTPMKPYQGKPALWIDGGTHGAVLAGTEVCLYVIDKLVSGYGADADLTRLIDDNAFYVCPMVHPDGGVEAGKPAPRAETPTSANGNYPEGWWKDDDTAGGIGAYPSSSPEARAVLEFFTNHTNILFVQSFHAGGGRTVRPYARWPENRVDPRDAAVFDRVLGKKYLELVGEAVPAAWNAPLSASAAAAGERAAAAPAAQAGRRGAAGGAPGAPGAAAGAEPQARRATPPLAEGWRPAYNLDRQAPGGYGVFYDWAYGQFGAYAVSTQAWDSQRDPQGVPGDGLAKICEAHWQFERFKASLMPRLAITDATAKVLYTTNQAAKAVATAEGDTVAVKKSGAPGKYKVVQVTATLTNGGSLPTQIAQGATLRGNRDDVVWLLGDRTKITFLQGARWVRLGVLEGTMALPSSAAREALAGARGGGGGQRGGGQAGAAPPLSQLRVQRTDTPEPRQTGNRRVVSWLIVIEGDVPLKLALTSQRGGTTVKDVVIQ
jgi:hypothetical protein